MQLKIYQENAIDDLLTKSKKLLRFSGVIDSRASGTFNCFEFGVRHADLSKQMPFFIEDLAVLKVKTRA